MSGRSTPAIPNLRVLVVDDDVLCLKIVTKMLQTCGYTGAFRVRIVARYRRKALNFFFLPPLSLEKERISRKKGARFDFRKAVLARVRMTPDDSRQSRVACF